MLPSHGQSTAAVNTNTGQKLLFIISKSYVFDKQSEIKIAEFLLINLKQKYLINIIDNTHFSIK